MSELLPFLTFSLIQFVSAELQVTKVAHHVSGLGVVDGSLVIFLDLSRFLFPINHVKDATSVMSV
jgi:hypothetical protein